MPTLATRDDTAGSAAPSVGAKTGRSAQRASIHAATDCGEKSLKPCRTPTDKLHSSSNRNRRHNRHHNRNRKDGTMSSKAPYGGNVATLPESDTSNAVNLGGEKETIDTMQLVAFDAKAERTDWHDHRMPVVVDARWYMARRSDGASPVYCSVWIRTRDGRHFSGLGSAGGYGYHKQSAALQDALDSAGVKLTKPIGGCGDGAICHAMTAIAKAAGYGRCPQAIV